MQEEENNYEFGSVQTSFRNAKHDVGANCGRPRIRIEPGMTNKPELEFGKDFELTNYFMMIGMRLNSFYIFSFTGISLMANIPQFNRMLNIEPKLRGIP